jgi:TetR/AcrR family tetracycline transcriptional repressor
VLGFVMEEQALEPGGGVDMAENQGDLLAMSKERFPSVFACAGALFDTDLDERFALGLDLFIAGLASRIGAPKKKKR